MGFKRRSQSGQPVIQRRKAETTMSSKSDLESEVAALKKQLAQIRDQSSHVADRLAERANGYVGDAVNSGRSRAQAAYQNGVQTAQDAYETGVQTAHDLAVDTAVRAREAEDTMAF